ncbi:hypothetical protein MD588_07100 [Photobacterium sp. SDRW27]|uniref:hypothetical protein n=1 Tax=Photobacterium obscurum TaxID=2829490 RepID=UPI002243B74B|nr:hypothetical protein [Photobacterium obscurum]MCW8328572.1 hypothetical protein [Photobacterium obscurum]
MKKFTRIFVATTIGGAAIAANASISFPTIDEMELAPLSDNEMSLMRGGFVTINDSVINIGLTMTTTINGETVLSTHIADFTINNGLLVSHSGTEVIDGYNPLQYISIGDNNINNASPSSESSGFIIQNTEDGTRIYNQTTMNIEADVSAFTKQSIYRNRLENSILYTGY